MGRVEDLLLLEQAGELPASMQKDLDLLRSAGAIPGGSKTKAAEPTTSMADDLKSYGKTAARVALGVGGALAGGVAGTMLAGPGVGSLGGAAVGSGLGETLSEWLFDDKLSPKQIALQTALGAFPGAKFAGVTSTLGRAAVRAGEGIVVGGGAAAAGETIETGEAPSWGTVFKGSAMGMILGGTFGTAEAKFATRRANRVAAELDKLQKLKPDDLQAAFEKEESQFNRFLDVGNPVGRNRRVAGEVGGPEIPGAAKIPAAQGNQFEAAAGVPPDVYKGGIPDPPKFQQGLEADVPPYPRNVLPGSSVRPTGVEADIEAANRALYDQQHATAQVEQAAEWAPYSSSAGSRPIPGPGETVIPRGEGAEPLIRQGPGQPQPPGWSRIPRENAPGGTMAPGSLERRGLPAPEAAPAGGGSPSQLDRIAQLEAEIAQRKAALAGNAPSNVAPKQEVPVQAAAPAPVETARPAAPVEPAAAAPAAGEVRGIPEPPALESPIKAAPEPVSEVSPAEATHNKIAELKNPNTAKGKETIERALTDLEETHGHDVNEARDALDEYRDIRRGDYDDTASYKEDKQGAWDNFLDMVKEAQPEGAQPSKALTPEVLPPAQPSSGLRPAIKIDGQVNVAPEGATSHAQMSDVQADLLSGKISPDADIQSGWVDSKGRFFDSAEAAQVADMTLMQKLKAALPETGTAGRFTPEQEAQMRLARAARADLYRSIEQAAKATGRTISEAAGDMGVAGPAFRRLLFEHTTDQAVNAFGKAADSMTRLNERAQVIGPEAETMGSTGNVSRETRPGIQDTWGNKKPQTYDSWISQKSKDIVTNQIADIGKQLSEARRVATSMGDKVTSQQFDEASKKFNVLQKELNRLADRYMKERLTAGRIVESYKRTAAVFPEEVMDELRRIGHMVDEGRKLRDKIPIATNIAESIGRVIKGRGFNALSKNEQVQVATDVVDHLRYDLFGPLTASFDLISNSVRAGIEVPVGFAGDIAHSVRQGELSLPGTAGLIRAIGIRRPSNNWPGMPKFLDDALAPARQPGEGMLSRRSSPQLQEKLGQTFAGEPIPGNLSLRDQINRPSQWMEKGVFQTGKNGVFTRRSNQLSAAYDTIAGAPMYSKSDADQVYKNIFGNGLIWREAFTAADKQGLRGIDRARFVDNFWANLPQTALDDAFTEANKAGWNRPLSHMAERWARNPAVKLFVDPFSRWTFQFGKWGAEMMGNNPTIYRKLSAGTLGPEEATRYLTRTLTGLGGVYALDRWFNQNPDGYVDYRSGEWIDSKNGDRQRLSNFEPVMTALMLGQVVKSGYAASTGDTDGAHEHIVKAYQAMRFSSLPMLKFLYGDGGLLGGPIGTLGDGLRAGSLDTQRLHDEMTNTMNHLIPGQAVMSLMKQLTDPTLREGLGANIPGLSYATNERIDMSTGQPMSPKQRLFGAELPSVGGTPLPGARRIVQPIAGALSKYGLMEYRGPRLPIAGYRASEAPEGVTREWELAFGQARNQILSQVLPSIQSAESRAKPGDLKPGAPYYEQIRKTLQQYDSMAAKHATDLINQRYLSQGKMPRRKTVRELSTASEVE